VVDEILIRIPVRDLHPFRPEEEKVALVMRGEDYFLLRRIPRDKEQVYDLLRFVGNGRGILVGDFLLALHRNHATGILLLQDGEVRKEIFFHNGEIIFAQSNLKEDRLGESLVRRGKITQEDLDKASKEIRPDRKLGKILIEWGKITPKDLFVGVREQVKEIVWSVLHWPGIFAFYEGFKDPESVIALNLDTPALLIEGIRRTPYFSHIPLDIGETGILLFPRENPRHISLTPEERQLMALIHRGVTLRELIDQGGLSVLETYMVVYHLLVREVVEVELFKEELQRIRSGQEESSVVRTLETFQNLILEIVGILRKKVSGVDIPSRINTFFQALPPDLAAVFRGVSLKPDGTLNLEKIRTNIQDLPDKRGKVVKAFNELLYFLLFETKNHLSDEDTKRIADLIQNVELY
jgi:hypothetical protein